MAKPLPGQGEVYPPDSANYLVTVAIMLLVAGLAVFGVAMGVVQRVRTSTSVDNSDDEFEDITITAVSSPSIHGEERQTNIVNGKVTRGKDISWIGLKEFETASAFLESDFAQKIFKEFTTSRKRQFQYAQVTEYRCKFARKKNFQPCPWKIRVLFLSHCQGVKVESSEDCQDHIHVEKTSLIAGNPGGNYNWTPKMNEFIDQCVSNHGKPKVVLRNMEDAGCFENCPRPSMTQIYNKIHAVKKALNKNPAIGDTFQMRQLIQEHLGIPDDIHETYIPYFEILDDDPKNLRFTIIFSSVNCLERYVLIVTGNKIRKPYSVDSYRLKSNKFICCDATYNLNWLNYPVFVVGTASPTGKFRICLVAISSHEDHIAQMKILNFVKSIGAAPSFLMGGVII